MEQEIWKPVVGWEKYYKISSFGRILTIGKYSDGRVYKDKIKAQRKNKTGYFYVNLCRNGKTKTITIHRLVAIAFIPNPNGYKCVDHIDTDRTNNHVSNLRWCTHEMNANNPLTKEHLSQAIREYTSKPEVRQFRSELAKKNMDKMMEGVMVGVSQFSKNGEFVDSYKSATDAARSVKGSATSIIRCCKRKRPSAYGFIWKYTEQC